MVCTARAFKRAPDLSIANISRWRGLERRAPEVRRARNEFARPLLPARLSGGARGAFAVRWLLATQEEGQSAGSLFWLPTVLRSEYFVISI